MSFSNSVGEEAQNCRHKGPVVLEDATVPGVRIDRQPGIRQAAGHVGLTRFDQFRKSLGIAPTTLTRRLATLTEEGVLEKQRYSEHPPREEYLLTAAGRDFLPVLFMIGAWGRQYRGGGKLVRFFDAETGTEIKAVAVDEVTGAKIGTRPIRIVTPDES